MSSNKQPEGSENGFGATGIGYGVLKGTRQITFL